MRESDIHIGDVLKVRSWDDMAHEYESYEDGDIKTPSGYVFLKVMRHLCGQTFTVRDQQTANMGCIRYYSVENVEEIAGMSAWVITAEMLEPLDDEADEFGVATDEEIKLLFC